MSIFSLTQKVSAVDNVLIQELAGQSVLLNLATEEYFGLDDVGTQIWETLIESDSVNEAIEKLLAEYEGVDRQKLEEDIENLIKELLENGLVKVSNS